MGLKNNKYVRMSYLYSFGLLRRLYDWVLSWAESKYATAALAINAFAESSFFPIPPDVLQIALSVSKPKRSFFYALVSSVFSILGAILGFLIGLFLFESIGRWIIETLGYWHYFDIVGQWYASNAFLAILGAAFTPIPFKVFTIAAGFWKINLMTLLLASAVGRSLRFFIIAALIHFFGAKVKTFIDKHFNWISLVFFVLLVLGFVVIKYLV